MSETSIVRANGEPIAMSDLLNENGTIQYTTDAQAQIVLSLSILDKLTPSARDVRRPTQAELMMYAYTCATQSLNPYLKECWLVYMPKAYSYQCIVAAQKRIAKAQAMPDYRGYVWGWITSDGTRHAPGRESKVMDAGEVRGCWGEVRRERREPFYHEVFTSEYHTGNGRPMTMLLKVCRDQTHRFAYADQMGNLLTENEAPYIGGGVTAAPALSSQSLLEGTDHGVRTEGQSDHVIQEHPETAGQAGRGLPGPGHGDGGRSVGRRVDPEEQGRRDDVHERQAATEAAAAERPGGDGDGGAREAGHPLLSDADLKYACDKCGARYRVRPARGLCVGTDADGFTCSGRVVEQAKQHT